VSSSKVLRNSGAWKKVFAYWREQGQKFGVFRTPHFVLRAAVDQDQVTRLASLSRRADLKFQLSR